MWYRLYEGRHSRRMREREELDQLNLIKDSKTHKQDADTLKKQH